MKEVLGIDVGATGIKGALVDVDKGELVTERIKHHQLPIIPSSASHHPIISFPSSHHKVPIIPS